MNLLNELEKGIARRYEHDNPDPKNPKSPEAYWCNQIAMASRLVVSFTEGRSDASGFPYLMHIYRVAAGVNGPLDTCVALLHDIIEDTECDEATLKHHGMCPEVVQAVVAITHRDAESMEAYIRRVLAEPHGSARNVKTSDSTDNLNPLRHMGISKELSARWASKYGLYLRWLHQGYVD